MAKMIPSYGPRDRDGNLERSREGEMYAALSTLPDDFWVLHSFKMVTVREGALNEREADFIVFHPDLGILCIEAKAGRVRYEGDVWRYGSGRPMRHGGPYEQASSLKYNIRDRFRECGCGDLLNCCKIASAVWFPSIRRSSLRSVGLASDADMAITLAMEDLVDPELTIRCIFGIDVHGKDTDLSETQARRIVERVLCPTLDITPTSRFEYDIADVAFVRLLESQANVLDFIDGQSSAAVKGAAGTGKTLIAVEYVKRASSRGEKTLFLCRTSMLSKDVRSRLKGFEYADVITVDAFADEMGAVSGGMADKCSELAAELMRIWGTGIFPYHHVVIDEGQDFGESCIRDTDIVELLHSLVKEHDGGTLYMFYDGNQQSMGWRLPAFIDEADCKLTLHVNCRNSRNIADCAIRGADVAFKQEGKYKAKGVPVGEKPQMFISTDRKEQRAYVDMRIEELEQKGLEDIVVVTCKSINDSVLKGYETRRRGKVTWRDTKVPFTTYTKFKGMEADAVILVDLDSGAWKLDDSSFWEERQDDWGEGDEQKHYAKWLEKSNESATSSAFYIAASRAKFELSIVCNMDGEGCETLVRMLGGKPGRKPEEKLAKLLRASLVS